VQPPPQEPTTSAQLVMMAVRSLRIVTSMP
jgi:hypothetical protein